MVLHDATEHPGRFGDGVNGIPAELNRWTTYNLSDATTAASG